MEQAEISFPFGKHKGEPIGSVPADYLQWILDSKDNDYFSSHPRHVRTALEELKRRGLASNVTLPEKKRAEIEVQDLWEPEKPAPEPVRTSVVISIDLVNEASRDIEVLKAFIRRLDQELGIADWMRETAKEAIKHGVRSSASHAHHTFKLGNIRVVVEAHNLTGYLLVKNFHTGDLTESE